MIVQPSHEKQKNTTFGIFPKSNQKIVETKSKFIPLNIHIRDRSLSWLSTDTSIKSVRIKLVFRA